MAQGNTATPSPGRGFTLTQMTLRTAFLLALLLGLGDLFGWLPTGPVTVDLHIVAGIIVLAAMLGLAVATRCPVAYAAAALVAAGGALGLAVAIQGTALGLVHLGVMVVAIGMTEMAAARFKRRHPVA